MNHATALRTRVTASGKVVRALAVVLLAGGILAGCGRVITITLPGGGADAASPDAPLTATATPQAPPELLDPLPEGYERLFSPTSYAFRFSGPGEPVRRGAKSERFELRPGDCGGSDCAAGRARAEIRETEDAVAAKLNRDIWYGYSFFNANVPAAVKGASVGAVFGQWRLGGTQPAIFRIAQQAPGESDWAACNPAVCSQIGSPADDVVVELEDMRIAANWGPAQNNGAVCRLFNMQAAQGRWMDVVVNTNFANSSEGYLRIWVNGELRCNYTGRLVAKHGLMAGSNQPSHRRGIFASAARRWAVPQAGGPAGLVVYYDEFLTGKSRAEVDTRHREANSARALD